jgi:hypothetical protein
VGNAAPAVLWPPSHNQRPGLHLAIAAEDFSVMRDLFSDVIEVGKAEEGSRAAGMTTTGTATITDTTGTAALPVVAFVFTESAHAL